MRRRFILALALCLFLFGCATNTDPDQAEQTATTDATASGQYIPGSAIEQQTQGAVRRYDLTEQYLGITKVGDKVLLVAQGENLKFTELIGSECVIGGTVEIPQSSVWQATHTGLVYYDAEKGEIVFLNPQFQQLKTVRLPENIQGDPVISEDGGYVFYCTESQVRVLETEHKISRILKTYSGENQTLLGSYFDGGLLACSTTDADSRVSVAFLSAENGQTLATDNGILQLHTFGDSYFLLRQDGIIQQKVVGMRSDTPRLLLTESQVFSALEIGGVVGCTLSESGFDLDYYAITDGKRTGAVQLEGFELPQTILADRWNNCLWILTADASDGQQVLLSWNPRGSQVNDETSYVGTMYTAEAPDTEGLNACLARVEQMNKEHGVAIRIWENALKDTNGYTFVPEHQVGAISKTLDEVEQILQMFPGRFLASSSIKRIRILIVRSINSEVSSTFYWQNSDPTIVLCTGTDIFLGLTKGLGYVIDSNVLGSDSAYGDWDGMNPQGFVYGDAETYSADYLTGDRKAFLSESAMTSAREDRSQIFWQAVQSDNAESFASETMQRKLLVLCQSIRSTWNLTQKAESYLWEQYLTEPIAYQG